jgi:hypothetical protein
MAYSRRNMSNTLQPARVRTDGKSTNTPDDDNERMRARVSKNSAYEKYKASLHEFFDGKQPLPDNLKQMLATRPGADEVLGEDEVAAAEAAAAAEASAADEGSKKKAKKRGAESKGRAGEKKARRRVASKGGDYRGLVEAVRRSSSPREAEQAVDALRSAGHQMPKDAEVLSKALGHKDEDVLADALRGLIEVADEGGIENSRLLKTRIENVALLAASREVASLCDDLKTRLS